MRDTVLLLRLAIDGIKRELRTQTVNIHELRKCVEQFSDLLRAAEKVPPAYACMAKLTEHVENLSDMAQAFSTETMDAP